ARLGNKVITLRRLAIGPLKLADLPESAYRPLSKDEVAALYRAADEAAKARKRKAKSDAEAGEASAGTPPAVRGRSPKAKPSPVKTATRSDASQGRLDPARSPGTTAKGAEGK
ncbi:MAG: pseudouridine synthase, partial [Pirellulaceae bacterium]